MQVTSHTPVFVFADFRLDPNRRLLLHNGEPVSLHPKAFELLLKLVENRHRVLTKNELLNTIWEGQFVEENNLAVQISALRRVFGEKSSEHRFIVTVPGRGYRFVSDVGFDVEQRGILLELTDNGSIVAESELVSANGARGLAPPNRLPLVRYSLVFIGLLAAVGFFFWLSGARSGPAEVKMNRLTTSGRVVNATLSADEKFIVFAQREDDGQALYLRQTDTGSQTRIIPSRTIEYTGLTISPDNNFVYFSTFESNRAATLLQRIPLLGGAPEYVGTIESGVPVSFSPDGKQFAFTDGSSSLRESYLKIADSDGGNSRIVVRAVEAERVIEDYMASPVAWSHDGSQIAVSVRETGATGKKTDGILLVDPETGIENYLVAPRFERIHSVAWQSVNVLAFVAAEPDALESQVWAVDKRDGEVKRLTSDIQNYFWLAAGKHGRLLTIQKSEASAIRVSNFDERNPSLEPREIVHEPDITAVAFGAGNSILYTSRVGGTREIWRVQPDGGDPQQLTVGANVLKGFDVSPRDGALVISSGREGGKSLWLTDPSGKNFTRLTDGPDFFPQFTPAGDSVVFQRGIYDFPTIWRTGLSEPAGPAQLTRYLSTNPAVSPDGLKIAFYFMDFKTDGEWRVGLVSTDTGQYSGKLDLGSPSAGRRMRWHPSGNYLGQTSNTGETANLILLPLNGGEQHVISNLGKGSVTSFGWSADGRMLVYVLTNETQDAVAISSL